MKPPTALILFRIFFWIFNASLLTVAYVGIFPFFGIALIKDALLGQVPLDFLIPFIGLVGVPTTCTIARIAPHLKRSRKTPKRKSLSLFQFFYSLEAPLLLLCMIRFFWLRDLTPGATLLLLTGFIGTIAHLHWLHSQQNTTIQPEPETSSPHPLSSPSSPHSLPPSSSTWWHLAGHTLMLVISLYMATIAIFYVLPFTVLIVQALPYVPGAIVEFLISAPVTVPILILVVGIGTAPFGMAIVYFRAWRRSLNQLIDRYDIWAGAFTVGIFAIWLTLFLTLQQPPEMQAFKWLETPAQTREERQELLQKSGLIRQGLLNAYLGTYRYPRSVQDKHIYELYRYSLGLLEGEAQTIQGFFNMLLAPFTYEGDPWEDSDRAEKLYAQFFDTPILRGEKPAIEKAIQSTFDRNGAKAGLADIDARRVWLAEQQITVTPHGDWADVELYEVYANQTPQRQEILYYFSLPESAVITGLWLGETGDRVLRFPFVVSTRGAAQAVYNTEVQRSQDPALLEQVGPRNYRLRAFPIPAANEKKNMHLWLTYKVLKQDDGWHLPDLHERRNLFWTGDTKRMINGERGAAKDQWLPATLPAEEGVAIAHQLALPWGAYVQADPFPESSYQLPHDRRFAVILDGSYSMNDHQSAIEQTFQWLTENILTQNSADLYLTTAAPAQPKRFDNLQDVANWQDAIFYGTLQPSEMLQQFQQLRGDTNYDAVLLVTDSGSYELSTDSQVSLSMPAPLWLVHLNELQFAYDDATIQAIQVSGGGISTDVEEVMQRLGTQPTKGNRTSLLNVVDGYAWYLTQVADPSIASPDGFEALAARQWVTHLSEYVKPDQMGELDTIHAVTKEYGIVSPYSSMIVLVNDQQREALKQAEQSDDRFNREIEDQQGLPQATSISAVPEPAEWLLLLVGLFMLWFIYQRQRSSESDRLIEPEL